MNRQFYEGLVLTRPLPSETWDALKPLRRAPRRWAKLDDEDVLTIRQMFSAGAGATTLAHLFRVQRSTIYHIVNYDTHADLEPEEQAA